MSKVIVVKHYPMKNHGINVILHNKVMNCTYKVLNYEVYETELYNMPNI
jgi:hypothetical protein